MSKKPSLLPSGWQHAKIRQAYFEGETLVHLWTIDVGDRKWQNVKKKYPDDEVGRQWFEADMGALGNQFEYSELDYHKGLRAKIKIDRKVEGNFMRNIITELAPPEVPEEVNVNKEKTSEHFYEHKSGRNLPL